MKALFTETYYREHWEQFLEDAHRFLTTKHAVDLEGDLAAYMKTYEAAGLPAPVLELLRQQEAQCLADKMAALVHEEMRVIREVEASRASFGYTTYSQEYRKRFEYRTRFEFNCLQLADFRKKYNLK